MAERTWEYLLPTGERLEARLDPETDVESVYLGPRLVSRSTGRKPGGHVVEIMHGEAAGPFRGGSAARVVFEASPPRCDVTVDERPLEATVVPPVAQPKEIPPDAVALVVAPPRANRRLVAVVAVALVAGGFAVWRADEQYKLDRIGALPLDSKAVSPNRMLRLHYSRDFDVGVRQLPLTTDDARALSVAQMTAHDYPNLVTLVRRDHRGGAAILAMPHTTAPTSPELDAKLATGASEPWAPPGTKVRGAAATIEKCFDKTAITMLRTVDIDDRRYHVWSCTFVRDGRGYRFVTFAPEFADDDAAVLRRVVLATDLL